VSDRHYNVVYSAVRIRKIISGGQSGVDRAALDAARETGFPLGGWCPRGRLAEDGPIPDRYPLQETATDDVAVRTELNVLHSDVTLILTVGAPQDGTVLTKVCAEHHRKPYLVVDLESPISPSDVAAWIERNNVEFLNVAGPRETHRPGFVYKTAVDYLLSVFQAINSAPGPVPT
jgi:hypothetical protein